MKVTKESKEKFIDSFQKLVHSIKIELDHCSEMCGGLNEKEMIVLGYVGQHKNVKMSDISGSIDVPMSTLTSIVDKLVERKVVAREHSRDDRRAINVTLTQNGKNFFNTLIEEKKQTGEKLLSQLNEKDQDVFLKNIDLLTSYLGSKKK
jgi:DNA-binding MarR family transcriptional regulator